MTDMDRRDFLVASFFGSASLLGLKESPIPGSFDWSGSRTAASAIVLRKNIYCLRATSPDVVAYRNAINVMRAKPATDGTSWLAQANLHGSFAPPAGMITDACEHSSQFVINRFFLSWHRIYLHFFERIVRAASGSPTFALPYWGYTPAGTGPRNLPAMFRDPAGIPELYVSQRNTSINAGNPLFASTVDAGVAMAALTFGGSTGFSSALEGTPHGVVHSAVGATPTTAGATVDGWMGSFEEAAQDPIFWLHHANIDRLWGNWIASGGGRVNPSDSPWLTKSWSFYDETGAVVNMTGAQVLDTAAQLGYNYASSAPCLRPGIDIYTRLRWLLDPRILELLKRIRTRKPWPGPPPPPLAQQLRVTLGSSTTTISLPISAEAQRILERFPTSRGQGNDISLVFSDVRLQSPVAVFYEVYANLPANTAPQYTSPYYVGNLSFFGPSPRGRHKDMGMASRLSMLPTFVRMISNGQWRKDMLRLTLVPRAFTEDQRPDRVLQQRVQATVGKIELKVE